MAQAVVEGLSLENPLFRLYSFYCSVLVLKMMLMSFLTSRMRFKNKAFANPEDVKGKADKVKTHEDVERVRRAHLNDLENIPIFLFISFIYILTNPSMFLAGLLIRGYTLARIVHTIVYAVVVLPQPARALSFIAGTLITGYMAVSSLLYLL